MKKIKMKRDQKGSENGTIVKEFKKGKVYVVADSLADVFTKEKWAVEMDTPESLEKTRMKKINILGNELSNAVKSCFVKDLDSVQLATEIENLEAYPIEEDDFQERFEEAELIKAAGIEDATKALKALNEKKSKGE